MDLFDVSTDLGAALDTIDGLRVFDYWADRITPPAAVVEWPESIAYDAAMARGADRLTLPVLVAVGKADARSAWEQLAAYAAGSGASSVKAAIERHPPISYDSARVTRVEFGVTVVASVEYLAATFTVDLIGRGAA